MKIAYVGNFKHPHCTEVHIAGTLRDLRHDVVELQEDEVKPYELIKRVGNADLFLFTRTWGDLVTLNHLKQLKEKGIPTASYHLDLYVGLKRGNATALDTDPFWRTDYVFTPDGDPESQKVFETHGINHHYIKPGVFKNQCYLAEPEPAFAHDVVFVGGGSQYNHDEWPYRKQLVEWLQNTYGDRYGKYGYPEPTIRNHQLNQLYASAKVVVGDSLCLGFNKPYYWSDRVYETMGRGGFIIHPYIHGMEEEFADGENIVFYEYGNFDQLKEKIDYYLQNDEERLAIRNAGHKYVRENCTYHNRLTQALGIIGVGKPKGAVAQAIDKFKSKMAVAPTVPDGTPYKGKPVKINLGAGSEPTEGWVNVDHLALPGIGVVHNLNQFPWPFKDSCADEIKAIDLLEHLANYTPDGRPTVIAYVEECHRILQPGGKLFIQVPKWDSPNMWIDPTHVRGFDLPSFDYFDPDTEFGKNYGYYSDKKFKVTGREEYNGNIGFTLIKR